MRFYSYLILFAIFAVINAVFAQALPEPKATFIVGSERATSPSNQGEALLIVRFKDNLQKETLLNLEAENAELLSQKQLKLLKGQNEYIFPLLFRGQEEARLKITLGDETHFFVLPISNCTRNFTKALNSFEETLRQPLLARYLAVKKGDIEFKFSPLFSPPFAFAKEKEGREAVRLYGLLRQKNGADPIFLTTSALGDSLNRSLGEMKGFFTQKETAGICAGFNDYITFYKTKLKEFDTRFKLYQSSVALALKHFNETRKGDEQELTLEAIDTTTGLNTASYGFVRTLARGQVRFKAFYNETTHFFTQIEQAHAHACICAD